MNDTGFPSPFIDIMMLSPALRTSQTSFCSFGSVISTTLPGKPRSPVSSTSRASFACWASRSSPANSTSRIASGSPRMKRATMGANAALSRASPIIVLSTSSTASGSSFTMCCADSIARRKVGKWQTPSVLWRGIGESFSVSRRE